jgi:3-hydroxyisobutyrate dehydrogenase-like beta-hydroxyacid dehydrogenase
MTIGRVGFIGLGAMGSRMAPNLVAAGFDLVCFDLAGTEPRMPRSATAAASAREVGAAADVILFSLPDGVASAEVAEQLVQSRPRRVHTAVDTSTIGVSAAKQVHTRGCARRASATSTRRCRAASPERRTPPSL